MPRPDAVPLDLARARARPLQEVFGAKAADWLGKGARVCGVYSTGRAVFMLVH
jgi:hypothetical protein